MIYHIYANRSNIGDWVAAKGIQQLLSPLELTECLCDTPFVKTTINRLSRATRDDFIIIGGGGLLMDYFTPFWEAFETIAGHTPFCIWGIGYCDLKHEQTLIGNDLIRRIIKKSKLTIVRDELTRSYLKEPAIPPPIPCPSINYIKPFQSTGKGILHIVNYEASGEETYEMMHIAARTFAEKTGRSFYETNHRIPDNSEEHMQAIIRRYQQSDIVISSALHGCIIGVSMGLKVLAVSGDRKIDAFMEAVGLKQWVLDISQASRVAGELEALTFQPNRIQALNEIRKKNQEVGKKIQKIVLLHPKPIDATDL
jgi:polysaccharide pyruvyl transferase WcaK-like protein